MCFEFFSSPVELGIKFNVKLFLQSSLNIFISKKGWEIQIYPFYYCVLPHIKFTLQLKLWKEYVHNELPRIEKVNEISWKQLCTLKITETMVFVRANEYGLKAFSFKVYISHNLIPFVCIQNKFKRNYHIIILHFLYYYYYCMKISFY